MKMKTKIIRRGKAYALLFNENATFTPWIVAYRYDDSDGTWQQGHYFQREQDALAFFYESEMQF